MCEVADGAKQLGAKAEHLGVWLSLLISFVFFSDGEGRALRGSAGLTFEFFRVCSGTGSIFGWTTRQIGCLLRVHAYGSFLIEIGLEIGSYRMSTSKRVGYDRDYNREAQSSNPSIDVGKKAAQC